MGDGGQHICTNMAHVMRYQKKNSILRFLVKYFYHERIPEYLLKFFFFNLAQGQKRRAFGEIYFFLYTIITLFIFSFIHYHFSYRLYTPLGSCTHTLSLHTAIFEQNMV